MLKMDNKNKLLETLDIPMWENKSKKIFCYRFHDVMIALTKFSILMKNGNDK